MQDVKQIFSECSLVENRLVLNVLHTSTATERKLFHSSTVSTFGVYIVENLTYRNIPESYYTTAVVGKVFLYKPYFVWTEVSDTLSLMV